MRALLLLLLASPSAALLASKDRELTDPFYQGVVYVDRGDRLHCTGALIAPRVVLTAAHCLRPPLPRAVYFGQDAANFVGAGVVDFKEHPSFVYDQSLQDVPGATGLDVGYIVLDADVLNSPVYPLSDGPPGESVHAVGYGGNSLGLRSVLDLGVLRASPNPHRFYAQRGVLGGDSGGPAFDEKRRIVAVAGSVKNDSWGVPLESVYVLVAPALPWLRSELAPLGLALE